MEQVKGIIMNFLSRFIYSNDIRDDDNIFEMEGVNSLFTMQLLMFLESNFNIQISNEDIDLDNFKSVNAILDFLETKGTAAWNS
ncbi:hypothetical protein PMSD_25225 [Paenibacillus macquariensis subsp. defensor]|nr:hypothetical protein PMSD_25225 [Paenibacillus macquariensis subsp. defensor]